ncbi:ABC transporter ATP-binding protein [Tolypothrix tenuis PCC 7101]|uniref:ABC transporter ATP-binding protein n=1 Tax=Tolypothrix tenuis PCC 7101 TaxID=231146 RepID=A0A1Z4N2K5_9CYAN|nr:molybdate ABC transporter permease subunit [Aulosira sp. FACHB-113]BAY99968.1 ABC transporter ATP-binding protein [Tolypothrix tenuis PCC 7101]BAZ76110.1 ABC transporter ATP-binding protein [Aulosira laxa NIES-50]
MASDLSPLWISLKTSLLATFITFFLGIVAAYWMLGYRGKAKSLVEGIFVAPLILPPTVVGFLLLIFFGKNGPVGKLMQPFDFSIVFTWYGAAIAATVVSFPLMYKTALGAFEQIDNNLLRVARTLGATESTIFWRISLPLALPGILAATTLAFARALGEFGATLMLAGNIPGQTQTIPMAIYFAVEAGAMDEAWFWSIVIMVISLSGIIAVNFWQESREKGRNRNRETRVRKQNTQAHESSFVPTISSSVRLSVDIAKTLPSFHLEVAFNSDEQPLGLLGGSGAGKSMILRCIAGIETPTRGRIVLNGKVLFDSEQRINLPSRDRRIGFLVQNYALFPHMTVAQNIAFGLPKGLSKGSIRVQVEEQLLAMQLQGLGDRYPHQLSGGQQQRVALARALASQPEALLLDEPFSALDTHLRSQLEQQMTETLADYNGVSLFVTHNMEEAYRVCPNLLVLEHGRTVQYGSKYEIFEHPRTMGVARITGCKNFSVAQFVRSGLIEASDWGCQIQIMEAIPDNITHVGIRAHHISFTNDPNQENTFPCWLASTSETPHRMTLFLKLHSAANNPQDYHLQAEVFKEKWATMKDQPFPWYLRLDLLQLILME